MRRPLATPPLTQIFTSFTGAFSSAFGAFAMLCCFGWTGLASLLPVVGLGFLARFSVALRVVWIALAFTALSLGYSYLRHRRPWALLTALAGASLLLYPMYHALEVVIWLGLMYSGLGVLFVAGTLDFFLTRRHARACARPAPASTTGIPRVQVEAREMPA